MAKHKKALHHHAKAGEAIKRGDLKAAAHHFGHALSACRNPDMHDDETGMDYDAGEGAESPEEMAPKVSLRDRLKGFKK